MSKLTIQDVEVGDIVMLDPNKYGISGIRYIVESVPASNPWSNTEYPSTHIGVYSVKQVLRRGTWGAGEVGEFVIALKKQMWFSFMGESICNKKDFK